MGLIGSVGSALGIPTGGLQSLLGESQTFSGTLPDGSSWTGMGPNYQTAYQNALNYSTQHASAPTQSTQPTDPNALFAGTANTSSTSLPASDSYWADQNAQLDAQLGRLGSQADVGNQNVLNAYNVAYQKLLNDQSVSKRNYDTAVQQTQQDNQIAKSGIDQNVRQNFIGAQRLLGGRGAGNSSASMVLAPYAAGLQGNQQRQQVQNAYGRNLGALDTNFGDTHNQFTNAFGDLGAQRDQGYNSVKSKQDQLQAQLLQAKSNDAYYQALANSGNYDQAAAARGGFTSQINGLNSAVDQLGLTHTFTPQAVNAAPVNLQQYDYTNTGTPSAGTQTALQQQVGPYLSLLNGDPKKKLVGQL